MVLSRRMISVLAAVGGMFAVTVGTHAEIINVPADQPTIQAGIDAAAEGDEVCVYGIPVRSCRSLDLLPPADPAHRLSYKS